ncbi:hypothetical protein [Bradyrhizobium sp. BR 10289]|uniref:hypothetical protein n=1 Tax=Bradyrhizobium sp. BR 10289 TaxID=2749993 RepID=UPI001C652731|nr:hypothetical protein [Bradyrhizobium sp. BR 10289]MBW7968609.1 hypothetical protein [Bradyrhizobium sp. BR 10289]
MADLAEKREAAIVRLGELQRKRGGTLLDNGEVPAALAKEIGAAEQELAAVDEALSEQARRERDAAMEAETGRRAALVASLRDHEAGRLNAIEAANKAAREMAEAMSDVLEHGKHQRTAINDLGGKVALSLEPVMEAKRLSGLLSIALARVSGRPDQFGDLRLRLLPYVDTTKSWRELEEAEGKRALEPYLEN